MTQALILIATIWAVTGLFFVVKSPSRGAVADIMFGVLWPVYWYTDWKQGLWIATPRKTVELLYPALTVLAVVLFAKIFVS